MDGTLAYDNTGLAGAKATAKVQHLKRSQTGSSRESTQTSCYPVKMVKCKSRDLGVALGLYNLDSFGGYTHPVVT